MSKFAFYRMTNEDGEICAAHGYRTATHPDDWIEIGEAEAKAISASKRQKGIGAASVATHDSDLPAYDPRIPGLMAIIEEINDRLLTAEQGAAKAQTMWDELHASKSL